MAKLLSPTLETCEVCGTRANHELRRVDTEDNYVEYACIQCEHPMIRSYERIPHAIEQLLKRLPALKGNTDEPH